MRNLLIEWKHFCVKGKTCQRCLSTGDNISKVLKELKGDPRFADIGFEFKETELLPDKLAQSNEINLNGVPLEKFIAGAKAGKSECPSCAGLVGAPADCRTVCRGDKIFEAIPGTAIREAILNWLGNAEK
jgi:hypothetical protein